MKLIDLTHMISPDMPVYPGTEQPVFFTGCSIEEDGFLEKKITLYSHTGTHMDAPAHLIKDHPTLDAFPIGHFYGPAVRLDFKNKRSKTIRVSDLEPYKNQIKNCDFILFHTGWSQYWGTEAYFTGYCVLTPDAADWLGRFQLKGIGLDTISADTADTQTYPVHTALLSRNILIIENLTHLASLPESGFHFSCFPIKFLDADGSPVRAVAYL